MQNNNIINMEKMFTYTDWNEEMIELYNKYSDVRELNHDLMRVCPVYAMYSLSEYLKRKRIDKEVELSEYSKMVFAEALGNQKAVMRANKIVEQRTFMILKPIVEDYIKARTYFVCAMQKGREEYLDFINSRDTVKAK